MTKARMIQAIIGQAKSAAILENKPLDTADLFFTLAFCTDEQLASICKALGFQCALVPESVPAAKEPEGFT